MSLVKFQQIFSEYNIDFSHLFGGRSMSGKDGGILQQVVVVT